MRSKRSISFIGRLIVSHLLVAGVAFQSGVAVTSTSCNKHGQEKIPSSSASTSSQGTQTIWKIDPGPSSSFSSIPPHSQPETKSTSERNTTSTNPPTLPNSRVAGQTMYPWLTFQTDGYDMETSSSKNFAHGVTWTKKTSFQKLYDLGYPLEGIPGPLNGPNQNVMILYLDPSARPHDYKAKYDLFRTIPSAGLATENCKELQVVVVKLTTTKYEKEMGRHQKCVAIMPHWGQASNVHRFTREPEKKEEKDGAKKPNATANTRPQGFGHSSSSMSKVPPMEYVSHTHRTINTEAYHWNKESVPKLVKEAWGRFAKYVQHYETALDELSPILQQAASGSAAQSSFGADSKDSKGVIIVMVTNVARVEILINFCCAAKAIDMDLSNLIVFCLDPASYQAAQALQLQAYYNPKLFPIQSSGKAETGEFGDMRFSRIMIGKVYSVHLVNALGYDVLFMDTDVVPLQPELVDYFADRWQSNDEEKKDIYLQYDRNHRVEQAPFSANSGYYFVKHNWKTRYFFDTLVRMEDFILKAQSHQQVMIYLMSQFQSLIGLKVKVLGGYNEDAQLFPNGWFYSQKTFLDGLKEGTIRPYIFHANWNSNGNEKKSQLKEINLWFVKEDSDDQCSVRIGKQQTVTIPSTLTKENCCYVPGPSK